MTNLASAGVEAIFDHDSPVLRLGQVEEMRDRWETGLPVESRFDIIGRVEISQNVANALVSLIFWREKYTVLSIADRQLKERVENNWAIQAIDQAYRSIVDADYARAGIPPTDSGSQLWAGTCGEPKGWHFDATGQLWIRHTMSYGRPGSRGVISAEFDCNNGFDKMRPSGLEEIVRQRYGKQILAAAQLEVGRFTPYSLHAAHERGQADYYDTRFLFVQTT